VTGPLSWNDKQPARYQVPGAGFIQQEFARVQEAEPGHHAHSGAVAEVVPPHGAVAMVAQHSINSTTGGAGEVCLLDKDEV
jgi:hypothetical protein